MEKSKTQTGIANLLLVFVIASLLALIVLALQLNSILAARRASQVRYSQTAFFAAEGALYETIQHLRDDSDWPSAFDETDYNLGGPEVDTRIRRIISLTPEGVRIEITATIKGVKRKLVANFKRSQIRPPLDVMLIIDRSGSMNDGGNDQTVHSHCWPDLNVDHDPEVDTDCAATREIDLPLERAQFSSIKFLEYLDPSRDRVGAVTFSTDSTVTTPLTLTYSDIKNAITPLEAEGDTNTANALILARNELDTKVDEETKKIIIILSDGIANQPATVSCTSTGGNPCMNLEIDNVYLPLFDPFHSPSLANLPVGTCNTNDAINQATIAKLESIPSEENPRDYTIFSIFFNNVSDSDCNCSKCTSFCQTDCDSSCSDNCTGGKCICSTMALGRKTLQQISNGPDFYYETNDKNELVELYKEIARRITAPEFFEVEETLPEPEIEE
ncbi:MAG TPA: VWA domain-containing protein [Candidatus Bathyarchaeia archaeon]|nr:VWA domain-containing protein [Candidatus Bathyarchaeia archaeon]